jgi:hypothetical protein
VAQPPDAAPTDQVYVCITAKTTIEMQCAQEVFSRAVFGLVPNMAHVGGRTTRLRELAGGRRRWNNTFLTGMADVVMRAGLVSSIEEGLALVVPAFAYHGKLPNAESAEREEREEREEGKKRKRCKI